MVCWEITFSGNFFTNIKEMTLIISILFKKCTKHTKHWFYFVSKAMLKKPVVTEVRTPTNTWSGLGFSKSMPAETIKELRRANHVSYKPTMTTTYEVCRVMSYSIFLSVLSSKQDSPSPHSFFMYLKEND